MKYWEQCLAHSKCPMNGSLQNVPTYLSPRFSEAELHQAGIVASHLLSVLPPSRLSRSTDPGLF